MPNAVLDRLSAERADQIRFVDEMLNRADADGRDLVDAEQANLAAARERIAAIDAQVEPIAEFESARQSQVAALAVLGDRPRHAGPPGDPVPLDGGRRSTYSTAGQYLVDHLAARGFMTDRHGGRLPADPDALARIRYAVENQTTADTPGLLPHPIVGDVVNLIDASRPFITSIGGGRSMGGIPGKTFGRPKITQHTLAGVQAAEKTQLPTRKMIIGEVPFTKTTKGGTVDVSRQDIDWSSPAAWDILIRDLADSYAIDTENEAADAFAAGAAGVNAAVALAANTLEGWATALYGAAGKVYASSKRLPDRIWCSVDVWGYLGPLVDLQLASARTFGESSLSSFAGNVLSLPRIVVPSFPAKTCVVGNSTAYEVYEEVIGLLTAVEPSLLGVEVAYGGYIAFNYVAAEGVCPVTTAVIPFAAGDEGESSDESTSRRKSA